MEDYRRRQVSSPTMNSTPTAASTTLQTQNILKELPPLSTNASSNVSSIEHPSVRRVVGAVSFFCASSLGAIFVNKACLTYYNFNYPSTLMVLQSILTIVLLSTVSQLKPNYVTIIKISKFNDYKRLIPSTLFFVFNVTIGLSALSLVNIPMFSAFRRLTVLFVMCAEYFMLQKQYPKEIIASVFILTLGAFVSALGDVTFTWKGYILVFLNNILTASYLTSIKRIMKELNLDPISLLYHQSILAFPLILCISIMTNDIQSAYHHYFMSDDLKFSQFFLPALSFVAVSAFFVNLSTSVCTHVTSPLTTAVAGQIKNVLQSVLGFFSWGYVPTPLNIFGLLVALSGQLSFAYFKYRSSLNSNNNVISNNNNSNSNNVSSSDEDSDSSQSQQQQQKVKDSSPPPELQKPLIQQDSKLDKLSPLSSEERSQSNNTNLES